MKMQNKKKISKINYEVLVSTIEEPKNKLQKKYNK